MTEEHKMECRICGETFDMRSLTEVFIHEHDGAVPVEDIIGEKQDGEELQSYNSKWNQNGHLQGIILSNVR